MNAEDQIRQASNIRKLPPVVFAPHPLTGEVILIVVGEIGYRVIPTAKTVQELNGPEVQAHHIHAALNGSMFGWHVPAADADRARERVRLGTH